MAVLGTPDAWTTDESYHLVRAARRAPVWCRELPWVLEMPERTVELYEVPTTRRWDRTSQDRLLSCGAVLTNLRLATRVLGWAGRVTAVADGDRRDLLAVLHAGHQHDPTAVELAQFNAISTVDEPTGGPRPALADEEIARRIVASHWCPGITIQRLPALRDNAVLAELLNYSVGPPNAEFYLTENDWWTDMVIEHPFDGRPTSDDSHQVFAVVAADDRRGDHLFAGAALQSANLTALGLGLTAVPIVGPLHGPRHGRIDGLIEDLDPPGRLLALLRVSAPTPAEVGGRYHRTVRRRSSTARIVGS